jgi:hypothetical protein
MQHAGVVRLRHGGESVRAGGDREADGRAIRRDNQSGIVAASVQTSNWRDHETSPRFPRARFRPERADQSP